MKPSDFNQQCHVPGPLETTGRTNRYKPKKASVTETLRSSITPTYLSNEAPTASEFPFNFSHPTNTVATQNYEFNLDSMFMLQTCVHKSKQPKLLALAVVVEFGRSSLPKEHFAPTRQSISRTTQ